MVNYRLCFSSVSLDNTSGLTINSIFRGCPNCGYKYSIAKKVTNLNKPNINIQAISLFNCSNCGETLRLRVAIYKDSSHPLTMCIQKGDSSAIPSNWWDAT